MMRRKSRSLPAATSFVALLGLRLALCGWWFDFFPDGGVDAFRAPTISSFSATSKSLLYFNLLSRRTAAAATGFDYDVSNIPCKEGTFEVTRTSSTAKTTTYKLAYKLFRPMSLSSRKAAPIVVLHGGPSLPSDYLLPLAKVVPYRSILFYDQLGCGASDEPTAESDYSIEQSVDDLEVVLQKLAIRRFHLYGQSFGGILAYEYLKRKAEQGGFSQSDDDDDDDDEGCLSVVLSSAPTSVPQVEANAEQLMAALEAPELFRETHQCRTPEMPRPLREAYAKAGTVWRGSTAISDYVAQPPAESAATMPSCLVLRGEYDFVSENATNKWKDILNSRSLRTKILSDCSHHGLLEQPTVYGDIVDSFFAEYD